MGEEINRGPIGIRVRTRRTGEAGPEASLAAGIRRKVKVIVSRNGVVDNKWARAISSQYFLLLLIERLGIDGGAKEKLIDACLESFSYRHDGSFLLSSDRILITPDETNRIADCMRKEDEETEYFSRYEAMRADSIDTNLMYMNFHYALLLRIIADCDPQGIRLIRQQCLDHLNDPKSVDAAGGWYSYRAPWLTARILITLKAIDLKEYEGRLELERKIEGALESLVERIDSKLGYWRSGVGEWVSEWESTALCLEALLVWNWENFEGGWIKRLVNTLTSTPVLEQWLGYKDGYDTEPAANTLLATVSLASVMQRVLKVVSIDESDEISRRILNYIDGVLDDILDKPIEQNRQFCTTPQLLYYALMSAEEGA